MFWFILISGCSMSTMRLDYSHGLVPRTTVPMGMEIHPDIRPWVSEFVQTLRDQAPACSLSMAKRKGKRKATSTAEGDSVKDSRPYCSCYQRIGRIVEKVAGDVGFPKVTARTLRHTFAARIWEESGHDLNELKKWTGTASADVAIRYAEAEDTELGKKFAEGKF